MRVVKDINVEAARVSLVFGKGQLWTFNASEVPKETNTQLLLSDATRRMLDAYRRGGGKAVDELMEAFKSGRVTRKVESHSSVPLVVKALAQLEQISLKEARAQWDGMDRARRKEVSQNPIMRKLISDLKLEGRDTQADIDALKRLLD